MDSQFFDCNFNVQLRKIFYAVDGPEKGNPQLILAHIQVHGNRSYDWLVAPRNLTVSHLMRTFPDIVMSPETAVKKNVAFLLRRQLAELLAQQPYHILQNGYVDDSTPATEDSYTQQSVTNGAFVRPGVYFSKTGWHRLPSGCMVFVAGDQLIGDTSEDYMIDSSVSTVHLPAQIGDQRDNILHFLRMLMFEPQVYPAVWSFSLATSLLAMFRQAQIEFQTVLYFIGKYNTGKSTVAKRLYAIYDEEDQPALIFDAGSRFPALREKIAAFRDVPVVVDDLCTSGDRENVRKRKQIISRMLRFAANKTTQIKGVHNNAEALRAAAGLAITAELGLDTESEWSCVFPVRLRDGQRHIPPEARKLAATTLHEFLAWVAPQYDALQKDLQIEFEKAQPTICKETSRISTTLFVISWVSYLFAQFCGEYCNLRESETQKLRNRFVDAANAAIRFLMSQIDSLQNKQPQENIAKILVNGIESDNLHLCKKRKSLYKSAGIELNGKIYLWPNAAYSWITSQKGYQNCTKIRISKYPNAVGILIPEYGDAQDHTVHLEVDGARRRFLCLNKAALYNEANNDL